MATTNTPLMVIDQWNELLNKDDMISHGRQRTFAINSAKLRWLLNDAEHLNHLNSRAMEMGYEDAEAALKALAEHEGK